MLKTPIRSPPILILFFFVFFAFVVLLGPRMHPEILENVLVLDKPKEVLQFSSSNPLPPVSLVHRTLTFDHPVISNDYNLLIDLTEFDFLINHYPCNDSNGLSQDSSTLILVLVHSNPNNWEKRQVIRQTWGSWSHFAVEDVSLSLLFLLGEVSSKSLQQKIIEEDQMNEDIIQGYFFDSYRNLTYKHVMGLKWATYFCSQANYVLKTDDDVFVNIPALVRYLSDPFSSNNLKAFPKKYILCSRQDQARVRRSYRSKWHVKPREYGSSVYPSYCSGSMILYSYKVVTQLYQRAQVTPYFWIDDVHVSGTLVAQLNITQTDVGDLMLTEDQVNYLSQDNVHHMWLQWWVNDKKKSWRKVKDKFLFASELEPNVIRKIWERVNGIRT
ncbi:hypothetical protein J437_LFUL014889 [Ladona fulva]|uniref:Hexosyltransferase n=1 Tax=Ladona fulva TaxID=123851 RepID=A0A8K0KKP2_LADFU|nr:hypothetical protein J437_LFUL014889 [Ladona fulva]